MVVGDAVCHGTRYEDWNRFFFHPAKDVLATTPFYLVPGNHEENAHWFYDLVAYPDPKNYYAFEYGNTQFIGLDSTAIVEYTEGKPRLIEDSFVPGAPQYDLLVRTLEASNATWKIVFFHYPPYVSADYQVDEMRVLCPVMEKYGVDVVFNSHTIVYERSHPVRNNALDLKTGITYVVAGGAGARQQWFHHKRAWHTAHAIASPHFVQVSIAGNRIELQAIDYQGHLFDMAIIEK
jgi:3',5'-cyclic AMP phosphodiesterase CpdA